MGFNGQNNFMETYEILTSLNETLDPEVVFQPSPDEVGRAKAKELKRVLDQTIDRRDLINDMRDIRHTGMLTTVSLGTLVAGLSVDFTHSVAASIIVIRLFRKLRQKRRYNKALKGTTLVKQELEKDPELQKYFKALVQDTGRDGIKVAKGVATLLEIFYQYVYEHPELWNADEKTLSAVYKQLITSRL